MLNFDMIIVLFVQGLYVDFVYGKDDVVELYKCLFFDWLLFVGLINGCNVWCVDFIEKYV